MNEESQEENIFHNEYTNQRHDENQESSDTISMGPGPVGNPSETEYDKFNQIFHTRCATFPEPVSVYEKVKYPLWKFLITIVYTFVILCLNKSVAKGYKTFTVFFFFGLSGFFLCSLLQMNARTCLLNSK